MTQQPPTGNPIKLLNGDGAVQMAYIHSHTVSHCWHESVVRLMAWDASHEARMLRTSGPFMFRADTGGLVEARNGIVRRYLDETPHEWLWMIDTDHGFLPDVVDKLVATAEALQARAVGALCFAWREAEYDGYGGRRAFPVPTMFKLAQTPAGYMGFTTMWTYPTDAVIQVHATGAGCLLLHRSLLTRLREVNSGDTWFDRVRYEDGQTISEDLSFCYRVGHLGERMYVNTGIRTTHHKSFWLAENDYLPQMKALQALQDERNAEAREEYERRQAVIAQLADQPDGSAADV
jgi:hypothetical protein